MNLWPFLTFFLLSYVCQTEAQEIHLKKSALTKQYEIEYSQTEKIKDIQERYFKVRMVATEWGKSDVNSAFEWVKRPSIPIDPTSRHEILVALVSEYSRGDPKNAFEKIKQISDEGERESLNGLVVELWAGKNFQEAESWVTKETDPKIRNSLLVRLIQGNKADKWENKLEKLYAAPEPDFVPILNIMNQNASDNYAAEWVLKIPAKNKIKQQLLTHLKDKIASWAATNPDHALEILKKQGSEPGTDFVWLSAYHEKLNHNLAESLESLKNIDPSTRNIIYKTNIDLIIKKDPQAAFTWTSSLDENSEKVRYLKKIQTVVSQSRNWKDISKDVDLQIQETEANIRKKNQPRLDELFAFVIQLVMNPETSWEKYENLPPEQKKGIKDIVALLKKNSTDNDAREDTKKYFENLFNDPTGQKNPQSPTNPQ